jgi:hypothetical protein
MPINIPAIAKAYSEHASERARNLNGFDTEIVREIWEAEAAEVLEFAVPLILSSLAEEGKISLAPPLPDEGGAA